MLSNLIKQIESDINKNLILNPKLLDEFLAEVKLQLTKEIPALAIHIENGIIKSIYSSTKVETVIVSKSNNKYSIESVETTVDEFKVIDANTAYKAVNEFVNEG